MRAIDLYAGVGGWSLGLRLAGVEVVAAYEWWKPAVETHRLNLGHDVVSTNIRELDLAALPKKIDFVVGSPPCTQFSYSNRGGAGDISDGLLDLVKFFEVVTYLKPRYWAMENVPRVAKVIEEGFSTRGHPLYRFRELRPNVAVIDMSDFGVPQARRRCIAGVLPFELLRSYASRLPRSNLGTVISTLDAKLVTDPVWGVSLRRSQVTEMETEAPLNSEEQRMNWDAKLFHPVYNNMSFPDDLSVPARTVTATCTRVSRESIVIEEHARPGLFRRLSVRERACLQSFPITYQFFGRSFSEKVKMVGNAIPPAFTYLVACAARQIPPRALKLPSSVGKGLKAPSHLPKPTRPDQEGHTYPATRRFRAAIKGLRFKSGMRFELANSTSSGGVEWRVRFFYGPSKDIREIELGSRMYRRLSQSKLSRELLETVEKEKTALLRRLKTTSPNALQDAWSRRGQGCGPYEIADALAHVAEAMFRQIGKLPETAWHASAKLVMEAAGELDDRTPASRRTKLEVNASAILSGLIVGCWFNTLEWHRTAQVAA